MAMVRNPFVPALRSIREHVNPSLGCPEQDGCVVCACVFVRVCFEGRMHWYLIVTIPGPQTAILFFVGGIPVNR